MGSCWSSLKCVGCGKPISDIRLDCGDYWCKECIEYTIREAVRDELGMGCPKCGHIFTLIETRSYYAELELG